MAKHLIVCGHGQGDPGAVGNGYTEAGFNRERLKPLIEKWAKQLKKNSIEFYNTSLDLYQQTAAGGGAYKLSGYSSVTELHLDASTSAAATGGHVICYSGFKADSNDIAIANVVKKYVGLWGSVQVSQGISYRNNLLNLNICAQRGVNYRLVELGFITNSNDVKKLVTNLDAVAKGFVEAITGESLSGDTTNAVPNTPGYLKKTCFDTININSLAMRIVGWYTPATKTTGQDIWVYFMNAKTGLEITRMKAKKIQRPDVAKVHPNPNGADVGFQLDAATPEILLGKDYFFLLRYANDNKEEFYIKSPIRKMPALINDGVLDKVVGTKDGVTFAFWHLASNQQAGDKHFIFIIDDKTGEEYARFDVTGGSNRQSNDVAKHYGAEIAQRGKCRTENFVKLPSNHKARGKKCRLISRYGTGTLQNHTTRANKSLALVFTP